MVKVQVKKHLMIAIDFNEEALEGKEVVLLLWSTKTNVVWLLGVKIKYCSSYYKRLSNIKDTIFFS